MKTEVGGKHKIVQWLELERYDLTMFRHYESTQTGNTA